MYINIYMVFKTRMLGFRCRDADNGMHCRNAEARKPITECRCRNADAGMPVKSIAWHCYIYSISLPR
jgi:hypothetical protein